MELPFADTHNLLDGAATLLARPETETDAARRAWLVATRDDYGSTWDALYNVLMRAAAEVDALALRRVGMQRSLTERAAAATSANSVRDALAAVHLADTAAAAAVAADARPYVERVLLLQGRDALPRRCAATAERAALSSGSRASLKRVRQRRWLS